MSGSRRLARSLADPNPCFGEVREVTPGFFSSELGMWVVTRYADCASILSDTERFSSLGDPIEYPALLSFRGPRELLVEM